MHAVARCPHVPLPALTLNNDGLASSSSDYSSRVWDAFYASVEQRDNPALKSRPVAVGYPAKRGVVAAASYRRGGSGCAPRCRQRSRCGSARSWYSYRPRFEVYRAVSRQIHAIFKDYTPLVEPLSLDEAYLDVTDNLKGIATAWETAVGEAAELPFREK
jgi:DNA polymerase-4